MFAKYSNLDRTSKYRGFMKFIMVFAIIFAHTMLFSYVWSKFYSNVIVEPFYRKGNWIVVVVYAVIALVFLSVYEGYKVGSLKSTDIVYSQSLAIILSNVVSYAEICLIGRRFLSVVPMLIMTVAQMCMIVIWTGIFDLIYYKVFPPKRMVLIYGSEASKTLIDKINTRIDKYVIDKCVSADKTFDEIKAEISDYSSVILCDVKSPQRNVFLKYCYENSVRVYMTPKISDVIVSGASKLHLFDTPLFLCSGNGFSLEQRFCKRTIDIIISALALIVASPFMIIIALCIKLYDRGPVFYKQERLTVNKKRFYVYKFRSMVVDAEKDGVARFAQENDDRITPVGKIIRKLRLDELPQILNILKGDMSVVGPRPERPEIAEEFVKDMPEFNFRLKVKAGLTGYAQIYGKYNTVPYDKLKLDLMYIENYSLLLDLKLIFMTIKILFVPESTQGIEKGKITPKD